MSVELSPRAHVTVTTAGVLAVSVYAAAAAWAATRWSYEVWIALILIPLLVLVSVPMVLAAGRRDPDPRFVRLLLWAFVLKGLATAARYLMAFELYDGSADAAVYSKEGARLALEYRDWNFTADIGRDFIGTGFVRVLTGAVYTVTGPSVFIAYAVFSWLGFWGLYFLYRAFRVAVPEGNARRYAVLVLFLPSMLFWPSGLGKEAFMTLAIGLIAYGSARLLSGYRAWAVPFVGGMLLAGLVRPHIAAAMFAGVAVAYLVRRQPRPATELTPLKLALAVTLIGAGGLVMVSSAADYLGVDEVTVANVDAAISDTGDRTAKGGSAYDAQGVGHVTDLPLATFSVILRPMLFEATSPAMLLAAAEGTLLLVVLMASWRSLLAVPRRLRREPYLALCLVYTLAFVYAFSNFSNFGILTRERVQVLPFVLVFLALRAPRASESASQSPPTIRQGART